MKSQFETLIENPAFRKELAVESLVLEATEMVSRLMEEHGVTKADLSRRLGKSRAWVTQLLNGSANMTLRTLAEVLVTLDAEARLEAKPGVWKTQNQMPGGKAAMKQVLFRMGEQALETRRPEDVFRIAERAIESEQDLITETEGIDEQRPEYAA